MTEHSTQAPRAAHWVQWGVATLISMFSVIGYVNSYVYPRTEGMKLEKQFEQLETNFYPRIEGVKLEKRVDQVESNTREELREMRQKLDRIYEILLKLERRRAS